MKSVRDPIGYVIKVEGAKITLNLLDIHKGFVSSHGEGVSEVTEIGSFLAIDAGLQLLVMRVNSILFSEPKEAHAMGVGSDSLTGEPLRQFSGTIVGSMSRSENKIEFDQGSNSSPPLGAKVYPLINKENFALFQIPKAYHNRRIHLGTRLNDGRAIETKVEDLISRHVAVLGSTGQGKSCFTAAVLQQIVKMENARIIVFDINGEYEKAFRSSKINKEWVKVTKIGKDGIKIPYYAFGRNGLQSLLLPSEKTQKPALNFAVENLNKVVWDNKKKRFEISG